jgi:hypothetical protein
VQISHFAGGLGGERRRKEQREWRIKERRGEGKSTTGL